MINEIAPLTHTVKDTRRITGLGTTKIYELMNAGVLAKIKVGRKTLITAESVKALVTPKAA